MKNTGYYRVIIACGHVGTGKDIEVTRYFRDSNTVSCYFSAYHMPRSKKEPGCVKLVTPITPEEFFETKELDKYSDYLQTYGKRRKKIIKAEDSYIRISLHITT